MTIEKTRVAAIAVMLAATVGCGVDSYQPSEMRAGKAETSSDCALDERFVVYGDFPSFSKWTFAFNVGALTDSHTDDLSADEWPTTAIVDPYDPKNITLVQVTHASDAIITTTMYLEKACVAKSAVLTVVAAQTAEYDLTTNDHYISGHVAHSGSSCDAHVATCRSECTEEMAAGDDYYCFETCMDTDPWPCPKLCADRSSRSLSDCLSVNL